MEFSKVIENRRSIRKYKSDKVEQSMIDEILYHGSLAPSSKNRQPWRFVVLQDNLKDEVADLMINAMKGEEITAKSNSVIYTANIIKQAPALIMIYLDTDKNWFMSDGISGSACIENMCLSATNLGLGSLWIADVLFAEKEISKLLKAKQYRLLSAITIGYSDEDPKQRPRKNLNEVIL